MTSKKPLYLPMLLAFELFGPPDARAQSACPPAQIACSDTAKLPSPVFMGGSSAFEPILSLLALQIKASKGVSIIYNPISSCNGVSAISPPADLPAPQPLTGTAHYYLNDPTDPTKSAICNCNLSGNTMASIGVSDVGFESCQATARPATLGEWLGPQQAMLIVVPKANVTTTALSAEQGAVIWGCGQQGNFLPFVDEKVAIQQRSATSGTQILVARNIKVAEVAFKGKANSSSSAMLTSLLAAPDPQAAIGFIAGDFFATHRTSLNQVAFRGIGQKKAYYADSDASASDLENVRTGRYMIQGPLHFFSAVDATGAATPAAAQVLDWLTGAALIDTKNPALYVNTVANNGDVPQCAMKVKIDKDGGLFSPYAPKNPCNCAFEIARGIKTPGRCSPCTSDTGCAAGQHCQIGYCE